MKFNTTAIAIAVAGTIAAPVAVQADANEVYASARIGIWNVDNDTTDVSDLEISSFDSNFGMTGETDLGNGMTGFGRYEWNVDENDFSIRHRYVGLKGDFGSVLLGQTYHTFYNYVVGPLDNPWWHSGYTMIDYRSRDDQGITYTGGTGNINFGATAFFIADGEETAPDAFELGASFALDDSTIALGYANVDEDGGFDGSGAAGGQGAAWASDRTDDIIAVAWSGISIADTTLGVSFMNQGDDDGVVIDWLIGNAYVHYEVAMYDEVDADISTITLGYTQSLGKQP